VSASLVLRHIAVTALVTGLVGCIPYTMGSTAQTVPAGEQVRTTTAGFVIGGGSDLQDAEGGNGSTNMPMSDVEVRWGLTDHSDLGIRIPGASGIILNHKTRQKGAAHPDSAGFATLIGGGVVNWAQHAFMEGAVIWSSARTGSTIRYGGFKVMHILPIASGAVKDTPTIGGFFGLRLGDGETIISPELGVYHDRSALGIRRGSIIVVPAVTLRGISFPRRIFGWF
jgi:hypothetical protein